MDTTERTRKSLIPEPVHFPETSRPRLTGNSQRGRSPGVSASRQTIVDEPTNEIVDGLPFASGFSSPISELPEENLESTTEGVTNSSASQNTNPVPAPTGQQNTVPVVTAQTPVVTQPTQNPVAPVTNQNTMSTFDKTKLPSIYGKNALQFNGKPEELPWYLAAVEEVILKTGATGDDERMKWIAMHYCEPSVKKQWEALEAADAPHTWEEFKAEIEEVYPEFKEQAKGSVPGLEKIVQQKSKKPIKLSDYKALQAWIRQYRGLAKQLMEPTKRLTNREAANGFLRGLSEELVTLIKAHMLLVPREAQPSYIKAKRDWEAANANQPYIPPTVDKEDRYVWSDLVDVAARICENESFTFYGVDAASDGKKATVLLQEGEADTAGLKQLSGRVDKIEAAIGAQGKAQQEFREVFPKQMTDGLEEMLSGHMDKFTANYHKEMQQVKTMLEGGPHRGPSKQSREHNHNHGNSYGSNSLPAFVRDRGNRPNRDNCFYCYQPGHFIDECENRKSDIDNGIVKAIGTRTVLYDGKNIPREPPHKSPRDKAHEYYSHRVVAQDYDAIMDQYFCGENSMKYQPQIAQREGADTNMLGLVKEFESFLVTRSHGPSEGQPQDFP